MQLDALDAHVCNMPQLLFVVGVFRMHAAERQQTGFLPMFIGAGGNFIELGYLMCVGHNRQQNRQVNAGVVHGTAQTVVGRVGKCHGTRFAL